MTKQLLALAAIARGGLMYIPDTGRYYPNPRKFSDNHWDPLDDDGDAFRLAARLRLSIAFYSFGGALVSKGDIIESVCDDANLMAATRLAIVRAAAKIGESME